MGDQGPNALQRGNKIECSERRADDPLHDFGEDYTGLGPRFVRFNALVDTVDGDYVAATVTTTNHHLKSPDFGDEIVLSLAKFEDDSRWQRTDPR